MPEKWQANTAESVKVVDGQLHTSELPVAAALVALDGTAWDGGEQFYRRGPDADAWRVLIAQPNIKCLNVVWTGEHIGRMPTRLMKNWTDESEEGAGRLYHAGEVAPLPRAIFHLAGLYRQQRGAAWVQVKWTDADWREWLTRWSRPGQFAVEPRVFDDVCNRMRNRIRSLGLGSKRSMPSVGYQAGWPKGVENE